MIAPGVDGRSSAGESKAGKGGGESQVGRGVENSKKLGKGQRQGLASLIAMR